MVVESKKIDMNKVHLKSINQDDEFFQQKASFLHKHDVSNGWLLLSKTDFLKNPKRINLGFFNRKTNFCVGEKNSLMFIDKQDLNIKTLNITEALKEYERYFLIYDLSFVEDNFNDSIEIFIKEKNKKIVLNLTKEFGITIGKLLNCNDNTLDEIEIKDSNNVLDIIIHRVNNRLSLNRTILVNSNYKFLLGIIEGYIGENRTLLINPNINIFNFSYIMNLLGAQYALKNYENKNDKVYFKKILFRLPMFLKEHSDLPSNFFRLKKYIIKDDNIIFETQKNEGNSTITDKINNGRIELIPLGDLMFQKIKEDTIMYDYTMVNSSHQNYVIPMHPAMHNSDGDVLRIIGVSSKNKSGSTQCDEHLSPSSKKKYLSLGTGQVQNWGVKLDSQLGLFNATN